MKILFVEGSYAILKLVHCVLFNQLFENKNNTETKKSEQNTNNASSETSHLCKNVNTEVTKLIKRKLQDMHKSPLMASREICQTFLETVSPR